ncbi:MAG: site-specific integrase, partial [Byssovorax sp.]
RWSKTDQAGAGRVVPIPYSDEGACPVRAVQAWLEAAGITTGPLFRGINRWGRLSSKPLRAHHVAAVVKACATAAGLEVGKLGGHSLRSGFATSAAECGATEREIMRTTGHRSVETVLRYIRPARRFEGLAKVRRRAPRSGDR